MSKQLSIKQSHADVNMTVATETVIAFGGAPRCSRSVPARLRRCAEVQPQRSGTGSAVRRSAANASGMSSAVRRSPLPCRRENKMTTTI